MSIIRLQNLLESGETDGLGKLVRRAQDMDRLTTALKAGLDAESGPHLVAANLRADGLLVILADSPAWAARFRYESDRFIEWARAGGGDARSCRIVVARDTGQAEMAECRPSSAVQESSD